MYMCIYIYIYMYMCLDFGIVIRFRASEWHRTLGFCASCTFVEARAADLAIVACFQKRLDGCCMFLKAKSPDLVTVGCFQIFKIVIPSAGRHKSQVKNPQLSGDTYMQYMSCMFIYLLYIDVCIYRSTYTYM